MRYPLRITGYEFTHQEVTIVELEQDGKRGRGECSGVYYHDDSPEHCRQEVLRAADSLAAGIDREQLLSVLPAGGARNAVDCALWDLEAKLTGQAAWQIAGLGEPQPLVTTHTLGADEPHVMALRAKEFADARALKLKLTGNQEDVDRVHAVRDARPDVWLAVDANQGFTPQFLESVLPAFIDGAVQLIEQPFPVGNEADLDSIESPIPLAADESAQDLDDLRSLQGRVDVINIKLDKCGGLTRALQMYEQARRMRMRVMVGCMGGTSLAMAPGFILGQLCDIVDLDGPIFLTEDRTPPASYADGKIFVPEELWGGAG
jgi:L-alanine-DL-glutamate epimerase-like enolase superfamily enzyme